LREVHEADAHSTLESLELGGYAQLESRKGPAGSLTLIDRQVRHMPEVNLPCLAEV